MDIKDKAQELVDKFADTEVECAQYCYGGSVNRRKLDIESALICVDEIISACEYNHVEIYNTDWWNKVKEEIQKL